MRVVLDTNILVSAFFWEGNESEIVRRCEEGELRSVTSPDILDELARVLDRKFDIPEERTHEYIGEIILFSEVVFPTGEIKVVEEDPADDVILETALIGNADVLITGDKHLLSLNRFKDIQIMKAGDLE